VLKLSLISSHRGYYQAELNAVGADFFQTLKPNRHGLRGIKVIEE
jgi:hypothetical protein